ncbi:hypothetical protein [Tateyamaria sp. ANG-S1]|uniref:hypothetical protein n=1 Tax=Tateyamaria sp. ANG-S1 TaxID=1577905 RepID=UPI00057E3886|nr:hypothetical protein [Tateyamaria sp. ANG-S1]KIC47939.1 hypothetical protein RA29_17120 [Tateyamaria sp. ANG-S1]
MTEKIGKMKKKDTPHPKNGSRYAIDPVAFAIALLGAPVLIALVGFWALMIPVFAIFFGGPIYVVAGTPVLLIYLHYRPGDPMEIAGLAFLTDMALIALLAIHGAIIGSYDVFKELSAFAGISAVMAPLWGAAFGWIYNRMRNDASRDALPHFAHI